MDVLRDLIGELVHCKPQPNPIRKPALSPLHAERLWVETIKSEICRQIHPEKSIEVNEWGYGLHLCTIIGQVKLYPSVSGCCRYERKKDCRFPSPHLLARY
jgi:hypothetical protein